MVRTTIKISEGLDSLIRHEAARRSMTLSDVIREALEERYAPAGATPGARRTLLAAGAGASADGDVAERIEEILAREWA